MAKFSIGGKAKFNRNTEVKSKSAKIVALVDAITDADKILTGNEFFHNKEQIYIIEYPDGWTPDLLRARQFNLDENKTYLFVKESELS